MFLVIGSYHYFEDSEQTIYGYSSSRDVCEKYISTLVEKQAKIATKREEICTVYNSMVKIPPQNKFEKLKDYQERIEVAVKHNEECQRQINQLESACQGISIWFPDYKFSIREVDSIPIIIGACREF